MMIQPQSSAPVTVRRGSLPLRAALSLIGALLLAVCAHPALAVATPQSVEYRVDGGAWHSDPPALFNTEWVPVPGASRTATLDIRTLRDTPTVLAVHATQLHAGSPELSQVTALQSGSHTISFAAAAPCTTVTPQTVLQPGDTYTLPVTLRIGPELTASSNTAINFQLELSLSDTGPRTHANGCPIDPVIVAAYPGALAATTALPSTGTPESSPAPAGVLTLIGLGVTALWLGAAQRRTHPEGKH